MFGCLGCCGIVPSLTRPSPRRDFYQCLGGVLLKPAARKRLIAAYHRRMSQEIRHPLFGYRCSYRRIFELEARLLARFLLGEIPEVPGFRVR